MKRSAAAVLAAALLSVPLVLPGYKTSLATEMLIFAALAMSIDILAGYAGRTSLGHGALFGVAAYVVLYHVTVAGGDPWVAALLGIAAATGVATIFAVLAIREDRRNHRRRRDAQERGHQRISSSHRH